MRDKREDKTTYFSIFSELGEIHRIPLEMTMNELGPAQQDWVLSESKFCVTLCGLMNHDVLTIKIVPRVYTFLL